LLKTVFSTRPLTTLATLAWLCATPVFAQDAGRMDQVIRASLDKGEFSGSVLVAHEGQILLDQGYGLANREWDIPNASDTKFRIASVSKQFTAVAILLLNERGQLDINAPIKTYLPDAPAAWDRVTVRHLLTHTSGIVNFTSFDDFATLRALPATSESLIARFRDKPLEFTPGEKMSYSNSGYVLLTAIIERVSGKDYAVFLKDNLFQPLAMNDSGFDTPAVILPHRASGYSLTGDGVVNADYIDMSVSQGAGGLYSTTRDLLKWEQGLFGGKVLRPQSLTLLTTPFLKDYAMGLGVSRSDGDTIIGHSGDIYGFSSFMAYDTTKQMTVIVLGNINGPIPEQLGKNLLTLARGGTVTLPNERQAVTVAADALAAYQGVYQLAPGFSLTISAVDGKLMAQATGQGPKELIAEKTDHYFLRDVDAQISFTRDASGAVDSLILHQGGREMPAKKQ